MGVIIRNRVKYGGDGQIIQVSSLPTASATELGKIYQFIGTTTQNYTNGYFYECVVDNNVYSWAQKSVQPGLSSVDAEDVTYSNTDSGLTATNVQDALDEVVDDIAEKQNILQYSTIPTASEDNVGTIIQYTGASNQYYTKGYFYRCIESSGTYSWSQQTVQPGITSVDADDVTYDNSVSGISATNVQDAVDGLVSTDGELRTVMRKNGAINYLPINGTSGSNNGLTWSFNEDGSLNINGTASANTVISFISNCTIDVDAFRSTNKFVLSGDGVDIAGVGTVSISGNYKYTSGGATVLVPFFATLFDEPTPPGTTVTEKHANIQIGNSNTEYIMDSWSMSVTISSGTSFSNNVIYTMLISTEVTDFTYAPYALTNRQITKKLDGGIASAFADLTDVNLTDTANYDVPVYDSATGKWKNESGHVQLINITQEEYDQLTPTEQVNPHKLYNVNNATEVAVDIQDSAVSSEKVWSSQKVNNLVKTTVFEIGTTGWIDDTTSQSGVTLKKKQISVNHVYIQTPNVDIAPATGYVLPSTAEQTAYNLVQYVTVDSTVPCLYLYASDTPTDTFYIKVGGVD